LKKINVFIAMTILLIQFMIPMIGFASEINNNEIPVIVEENDRIDLPNNTIKINVGSIFYPENYATAYRGNQQIPYGDGEFTAIYNDVDTSMSGTYTVVYRLENNIAGTYIDSTMTVIIESPVVGADVTIQYQDIDGNTIAPNIVKSGNIGDSYSSEQLTIEGYTFKEIIGNPTGTFTDSDQMVYYIYTKNVSPIEPIDPNSPIKRPLGKTTSIRSNSTNTGLPQTGESTSALLTILGGMSLVVGAYILNLKRKKAIN